MRILRVSATKEASELEIQGLLDQSEFRQLLGELQDLCIFSQGTIIEPASAIKTGARHSYAKYLLFPVKLRRQYKTDAFDFTRIRCGVLKYQERLYAIYDIPSNTTLTSANTESASPGDSSDSTRAVHDEAHSRKNTRYPSVRRAIKPFPSRVERYVLARDLLTRALRTISEKWSSRNARFGKS